MEHPRLRKLKLDLRALLQSAGTHGLTLDEVERDYADLFQGNVPYAEFGLSSTHELLSNLPDVVMVMPAIGDKPTTYYAISDPSTRHLEELIDRQRVRPPTRFGGKIAADLLPDSEREAISAHNSAYVERMQRNGNSRPAPPPGFGQARAPPIDARSAMGGDRAAASATIASTSGRRSGMEHLMGILASKGQQLPPTVQPSALMSVKHSTGSPPAPTSADAWNRSMPTAGGNGQLRGPAAAPQRMPVPSSREIEGAEILRRLNEMSLADAATRLPANSIRFPSGLPPTGVSAGATASQTAQPSAIPFDQGVSKNISPPGSFPSNRATAAATIGNSIRFPLGPPPSGISHGAAAFQTAQQSAIPSHQLGNRNMPAPVSVPSAQAAAATKGPTYEQPQAAAAACASARERHNSGGSIAGSVTTTARHEFPEEAPIILQTQLPVGVKMPHKLWETIYGILRDQKGKWMDVRQFQTDYARRMKKPLSADYLLKHCGIRSYKQLFVDIPHIDVMHSPDEVMYVRLMAPSINKKNVAMFDVKPRYNSIRPQTHGGVSMPLEMAEALENEEILSIPDPPIDEGFDKNPHPTSAIPQDLRVQVYQLLWHKFRNGIDISTFSEAFTKRYGASLNTSRTCGMSLEAALYYMADIVDLGKVQDGKIWVRPVPYDFVKKFYQQQKKSVKTREERGLAKKTTKFEDDADKKSPPKNQ